ncbi:MAG: DDE-type integrase/transposase/recombinase [Ignavibacteriales bacterium]|nr:DDE-type integrase/transposase/recombinase [Ignavibacteriales bacterium]
MVCPKDSFGEGRGERCTLLCAIDDASGRVFLRFARSENVHEVFVCWRMYIERYGIPAAIYTDFGSVYQTSDKKQTQYKRAMAALRVECIFAHSPEAKGRVERSHRTQQDRLIKALRREGISTIDEANRFLELAYLNDFNAKFATTDGLPDVHRAATGYNLDNIFCREETRHVYNDWTITLNAHYLQLQRSDAPLPPPRAKVIVRRWLDNSLHIFWNNNELAFTTLKEKPTPFPRLTCHPPSSHPWKRKWAIGKAKSAQPWKSASPPKFVSSP